VTTSVFKRVDYTLDQLLAGISLGTIGLPDIQRPFIWKPVRVRDLFDSMYQGYPVGHLLLWAHPGDEGAKDLGVDDKPKSPDLLILDGQQRLTSLYSVMCDKEVRDKDYRTYRIQIAFNPVTETFAVPDAAIKRDPEFLADITELWTSGEGGFAFTTRFLESLEAHRELSRQERKTIADSISRLEALDKYPFIGLELAGTLEEERAAEVFVRINSEGVTLKQADFILTLMSVFQEKLRLQLEAFSRSAQQPSASGPSPFNYFIQPSPDQLLRVGVGVAFFRGRLKHVYTMLRGKDMETGESSPAIRDKQFEELAQAQEQVLDLTTWLSFHKALMSAGYASGDLISSGNAILYAYTLFILGKNHFNVDHSTLRKTIARWFFMSSLTGRYTNSPESAIEEDLAKLRNKTNATEFLAVLDDEIAAALTPDYWAITLPNDLATSAARSPTLFAYYAALRLLKAQVLFSNLTVAELLDPAIKGKKSAVDRHHLFPRGYLKETGNDELRSINQIANFTLVEWEDNIDISDDPPSAYVPEYERRFTRANGADALAAQYTAHALPEDWWKLDYETFLTRRRSLMADVIRQAFEKL
jgi:hypothetical protein